MQSWTSPRSSATNSLDHFAVSVQLGHEDGGTLVMSRYGHPSKEAARERLIAAFRFSSIETGS